MRRLTETVILTTIAIVFSLASPSSAGGDKPPVSPPGEHDFGGKLLFVRMRQKVEDGRFFEGYLDSARVRRLGDRYFVVGQQSAADQGRENPLRSIVTWLPLSEVAELAEYQNWEAVKKAYEALQKARPERDGGKKIHP